MGWQVSEHMTTFTSACLLVGHHPSFWHQAIIVVIPKLEHDNYLVAKNYCPISLLECFRKLLEKVVARRLLHDIDWHCLIPSTQFGTRAVSCTLNAGLSLLHDVQVAHHGDLHCATLLCDIKGFFNNMHKDNLVTTLHNLGFPAGVCGWVLNFLSN